MKYVCYKHSEVKQFTQKLVQFFHFFFVKHKSVYFRDVYKFHSFLFCKKCSFQRPMGMFWMRRHLQKQQMKFTKTKGKPHHHTELIWLPCVVILLSFCSHIYSSSTVICPLHACPARQGSPGRTNSHRRLCSSPTVPLLFPILSPPFPPRPCLHAPPVYLMTWTLIRLEAPWCPVPGASISPSSKVSHAVSHMSWVIENSCPSEISGVKTIK